MEIKKRSKMTLEALNRESPTILTGLGISGVITTAVLAARATPAAMHVIRHEKLRRFDESLELDDPEPLTFVEKAKLTWRLYLPAVLSGATTIACIAAANRIHLQRTAALAGLYSLTESALTEYQAKVIEMIGEMKEGKIRDEIAEAKLKRHPIEGREILLTGNGEHLFFDSLSSRYFKSDIETIRKAVNDFNAELFNDMYKPLNDFYDAIGLEGTEMGRNMGWDVQNELLNVRFSAKIASNNEPCIVLEYSVQPRFL